LLNVRNISLLSVSIAVCMCAGLSGRASAPVQNPQVIEVTAKKYEFNPSPIRVKQGSNVQLKITAVDTSHGIKFNLYPDGVKSSGAPGLVFASKEDCFKLEKGASTTVEFEAKTAGTYSFKCCKFCGMGHGGMKGKLVVEP